MLRIFPVEVSDLAAFRLCGMEHPDYGPLFELGIYMSVTGLPGDVTGSEYLLGSAFEDLAKTLGFQIERDSFGTRILDRSIFVAAPSTIIDSKRLHDCLSSEDAVSVVFTESSSDINPLCLLVGPTITSSGAMAPCAPSDLWETWFALVGVTANVGQNLAAMGRGRGPNTEERLMERLRQLYGGI